MAIVKCPECGRDVSDKAKVCPGCGFEVNNYFVQKEKKTKELAEIKRKQKIKKIFIGVAILLIISIISGGVYWFWKVKYYYSPEELANIEDTMKKIETITVARFDQEFYLHEAKNAYNALTDREKNKVTNIEVLETWETELQERNQKKAEKAILAIDEIGEVTFDWSTGERIEAAKSACDEVHENYKNLITNYDVFIQAQSSYEGFSTKLNASAEWFENAQRNENVGQIELALTAYRAVIPEDTENYAIAQEKIIKLEERIKEEQRAAEIKAQQEEAASQKAQAEAQAAQQKAQNDKYYPTVASVMKAFQSHFGLKMSKVTEVRCVTTLNAITVKAGSTNYIATNLENAPSGLRDVVIKEYDSGTGYAIYKLKMNNNGLLAEAYDMTVETIFKSMRDVTNMNIDLTILEGYM